MRLLTASLTASLALSLLALLPSSVAGQVERTALSEYRAGLMNTLSTHNASLRAIRSGEVSHPDHLLHHARGIDAVTQMLTAVWPEGSGGEGTRASTTIWENGEDFRTKVRALREAAMRLREGAEAGDMGAVDAAMSDVGQTCRACHSDYRTRAN